MPNDEVCVRDPVFPNYEKLHFELFEDLFFAGNVKVAFEHRFSWEN